VNDTTGTLFLAVIATATAVMAAVQVGLVVVVLRLARRVDALTARLEQEVRPILANLQSVSSEAARATALAATQVERVDRVMTDLARRVDETASLIQQVVVTPAREGRAVLSAVVAALTAFRGIRRATRPSTMRPDEEDPLFIG